jgi:hypothetical protein
MNHTFAVWVMRFVEGAFFTGLLGCVLVVIISWISVLRAGFSRGD